MPRCFLTACLRSNSPNRRLTVKGLIFEALANSSFVASSSIPPGTCCPITRASEIRRCASLWRAVWEVRAVRSTICQPKYSDASKNAFCISLGNFAARPWIVARSQTNAQLSFCTSVLTRYKEGLDMSAPPPKTFPGVSQIRRFLSPSSVIKKSRARPFVSRNKWSADSPCLTITVLARNRRSIAAAKMILRFGGANPYRNLDFR